MKKIVIIVIIVILLIIPFFIFNDKKTVKKENKKPIKIEKEEPKEKFKYITTMYDNINEYMKEEIKEEEVIKYVCIE